MSERDVSARLDRIEDQLSKVVRILVAQYGEPPPRKGFIAEPLTDEEIAEAEREGDKMMREVEKEIAEGRDP